MKPFLFALLMILSSLPALAQREDAANTGDDFSLEGALELFKRSTSLDEFEQLLNREENNVNNLDLNNDGETDYLVVNAMKEGDVHAIVISTYVKDNEIQDIAVIGIEKVGPESARIQIEGDADLFPVNSIVEPKEDGQSLTEMVDHDFAILTEKEALPSVTQVETDNVLTSEIPSYFYHTTSVYETPVSKQVFVNVWFWPGVRFVYAPGYVAWHSPWRWGLYPKWWRPWRPVTHRVFYKKGAGFRVFYHRVPVRNVVIAHRLYAPGRRHSSIIIHKNKRTTVVIRNKPGRVKATRMRRGRRG